MRLLLDTHVLLWSLAAPGRIPAETRAQIALRQNRVYASAASIWELAIKAAIGKLPWPIDDLETEIAVTGFEELPVRNSHGFGVRVLPLHHRDPFDRILIAQALEEGLTIETRDRAFAAYQVPVLWQ